jgi:cell division transport system ATP-binding protein
MFTRALNVSFNPTNSKEANQVIRFENVGLRYGMGPEVLRNVSFHLAPGSFHFLTGPSGAGKTSLLQLLFLAQRPTRGLISIFGQDVATLPRHELPAIRRRIGVVFQEFRLLSHLTTYENVALPLRIRDTHASEYESNVVELLRWVGLGERLHAIPEILSGGEKQRAAIARAVVGRPALLLADEPTGNVDPELAQRLLRLFVELNKLGTTILIATHDVSLMESFGAPRLVLEDGELEIVS